MADEADRKSPESDKLLLDLAWERQQKKVSNYCSVFAVIRYQSAQDNVYK